jgi:hypothetical protein
MNLHPRIKIIDSLTGNLIYCDNGWMYSEPKASDYERIAKEHFGDNPKFTVYYNNDPVCGRHRNLLK